MNPQDPLASLRPLREPAAIDWWPPAPGWWFLALLLLLAVTTTAYVLRRHWRRNAYRRQAVKQLVELQQHTTSKSDASFAGDLNALLKSTALVAYPPKAVAAMHGEQWRAFLNQELDVAEQFPAAFFDAAYLSEPGTEERQQLDRVTLHRCAERWIKKHQVTQ